MANSKTTKPKTAGKATTRKAAAGKRKTGAASKAAESLPTDEVLREIEDNLIAYAYNMKSPATDREGKAWRKVAFSGPLKILAKLVKHPVAQTLETLTIVDIDEKSDKAIRVLAEGPPLAALRELRLGFLPEGQDGLVGFEERNCGDLTALSRACPRLEILRLLCPGFVAGDHPTLRVLDARTGPGRRRWPPWRRRRCRACRSFTWASGSKTTRPCIHRWSGLRRRSSRCSTAWRCRRCAGCACGPCRRTTASSSWPRPRRWGSA
ncbi:hypothetical protein [Nannocystis pusilla]|uniref:hypothetical protein n=1 Tax=Nannocystis pusilla TaxID=889268 RepID=UPI003B7D625C